MTDDEIMERAREMVSRHQPRCPECGAGVLAQKCFYDAPADECPRHESRRSMSKLMQDIATALKDMRRDTLGEAARFLETHTTNWGDVSAVIETADPGESHRVLANAIRALMEGE